MSHFVLTVIGDDVEGALAPFQENNCGDCPEEYLAFHDQEDELIKEYKEGSSKRVRLEDGSLVLPWDERFRVPGVMGIGTDTHKVPEHLVRVEVPFSDLYPNLEAFVRDWHGQDRDRKTGKYGYWENPNAKWDWWTIGGRWAGMYPTSNGPMDSALKMEILWDVRRDEQEARGREEFARWQHVLDAHPGVPRPRSWTELLKEFDDQVEKAREAYIAQPQIKTWKQSDRGMFAGCPVTCFGFDLDAHISRVRRLAATPFAFLINGEWHERGEMGWWGAVHDEKEEDAWFSEWEATWDSLPDDARLTCVDCHI